MWNVYLNLSIFTVFLKNKNIIFKIGRSKVTDYAALNAKYTTYLIIILEFSQFWDSYLNTHSFNIYFF